MNATKTTPQDSAQATGTMNKTMSGMNMCTATKRKPQTRRGGNTLAILILATAVGSAFNTLAAPSISDIAGNGITGLPYTNGETYVYDTTAPSIAISTPSSSLTKNSVVTYTVTYTDANFNASTLATGDITLNKTGTANGTVGVSGSGTTRTVTISSITGDGTLGISIAAGTATDLASNSAAAAGPSTTFTVDNTPPVITSAGSATGTNGIAFSYAITATGTATAFEASGLPLGLSVNAGTGEISGIPTQAGAFSVEITASDAAGNTDTNTLSLTVEKAAGIVLLGNRTQSYDGTARPVAPSTIPSGLSVNLTYDGLASAPTNVGSYTVIGTINDSDYAGSVTNTLTIASPSSLLAVIAPANYVSKVGNSSFNTALNTSTRTLQMQYAASAFTNLHVGDVITGLRWRLGTSSLTAQSAYTCPAYTLKLGQATKDVASVSTTFADNMSNPVTVFDGALSVPADSFPYGSSPNSFSSYTISFSTDYTYQGGDLVVYVTHQPGSAFIYMDGISSSAADYAGMVNSVYSSDYNAATGMSFYSVLIVEFVVAKGKDPATVTLANLNQVYDGTARAVTAVTEPAGLTVDFTYDGLVDAPTNAGSYTVIGTINDADYAGSATNTLVIDKASATVLLGSLSQTYDGAARLASASTTPEGLTVELTYDGSINAPTNAGSYTVIGTINDANYAGSATNTLVIDKASATVLLGSLSQTYDGAAKPASASTTPTGLTVDFTYDGNANAPTNAGSCTVIGSVNDANYAGSATNTLVIGKASATVLLGNLNQTYDGTARPASASTTPTGLTVDFTYDGNANAPTNAGSYTVIGSVNDANYAGSATNTLVIGKGSATVLLGSLSQTYDGAAKPASATTTPTGLTVDFTYDGNANAPTNAGSYTVIGSVNDANYAGSATNTLVIGKGSATVLLGSLSQTYDGTARPASASTTPTELTVDFTYDGVVDAPTNAGSYTVIGTINDSNYAGSATNTLVIGKAAATVLLGSLSQTYAGTARPASASTTPTGLTVDFTYDGVVDAPTNAGSYTVIGTINESNYAGSATNTLVIDKVSATVLLGSLSQTYVGTARPASASTTPTGLTVDFTYDGLVDAPTNAGNYTVIGTINDVNYAGSATNTLVIDKAEATVLLGSLSQTYDDTARPASATTTPTGLTVDFTYAGSTAAPTNVGSYTVIGTVNDANYTGSATNTLVIGKATATVLLSDLSQTYDGTARPASATTTPTGLTVDFTYDGETAAPTNVGSYEVVGTVNDANYAGSATNTLEVAARTLTASANNTNRLYGDANPPLTIRYSGFADGEDCSVLTELPTAATAATATSSAGQYPITLSGGSASNYTFVLIDGQLTVDKAVVVVTPDSYTRAYGATNPPLTGTIAGCRNGDTLDIGFTTYATPSSPVGQYAIVAYVKGLRPVTNYTIASYVDATLTITPAVLTARAEDQHRPYGATNPALTIQYSGFVNGEDGSALTTLPIAATTATPASSVGNYPISVSGGSAHNYTFAYEDGMLTVDKAALTIQANDASRSYGAANPTFDSTITGLVDGDALPLHYSTTAVADSPAGTYPIVPEIAEPAGVATNYAATLINGTLTVTADDPPAITLAAEPGYFTIATEFCLVDESASVTDGGSLDFDGGTLTVTIVTNVASEDLLSIKSEGTSTGQIGLAEDMILYGGSPIGTFAGGQGTNALVVTLNTNATPGAAQALIRHLTFGTVNTNAMWRCVEMTITDGDGGSSAPAQRQIRFNHAPEAHDQIVTVSQGIDVQIPFSLVLTNASDPDGDTITVNTFAVMVTDGGSVSATDSGFIYRSREEFSGEDQFLYHINDGRGGEDSGTITVQVVPKDQLAIGRPTNGDGAIQLKMAGIPNQAYRIDVSIDLVNWSVLKHVTASPTGLIEILDAEARNYPQRYYRAVAE